MKASIARAYQAAADAYQRANIQGMYDGYAALVDQLSK